jgi:hypothetical protein
MENSVENNVSRQPELLDDENPEEGDQGDQDIPFSSKLAPRCEQTLLFTTNSSVERAIL